jgi:mRNA interferase MazF
MIYDAGDVVVVPFPFSDMAVTKARPALVVSPSDHGQRNGETLLAMITTAAAGPRPSDTALVDLGAAGLKSDCVVRLKLFTLDNRLISRRIGRLSDVDRARCSIALRGLIAI